jgi:hypothetical protein
LAGWGANAKAIAVATLPAISNLPKMEIRDLPNRVEAKFD